MKSFEMSLTESLKSRAPKMKTMSQLLDSNQRPAHYEGAALPLS